MLVTYTPEGQEPQEFTFSPGQLRMSQQAILERAYSKLLGEKASFMEFVQDVRTKAPDALRVLLHWCQRQVHPTIRLEDVDPRGDEVQIRFHRADFESARELIAKIPDPKTREQAYEILNIELASAVDADSEPGKAAGRSSSSAAEGSPAAAPSRRRGRTTTSPSS